MFYYFQHDLINLIGFYCATIEEGAPTDERAFPNSG